MNLFILGATGAIGKHLLDSALERGHQVTSYVRSPQKIHLTHERLKVVRGSVFDADQSSQSGSKPTPSTVRDSTYVLDGVLDNETELPIAEHTTDTAGYTDIVFGLFDLLGLQFSPRLRDLGDQTLYRIDKNIRYQHIGPLVRGTIKPRLFLNHWDDLLRTAGSLKLGWVTASLFIAKLQSSRRKNALTCGIQEYGRLV